jgi:hypothetical protein
MVARCQHLVGACRAPFLARSQIPKYERMYSRARHRTDAIFQVVVVDGQIAVVDIADRRRSASQAVLDCFACRGAVGDLATLTR